MLDQDRLDRLFQLALATAASADEFGQRDLGPIHLLKYAYFADVAHAERHGGSTFSGVEWRFHNFGPWSTAAFERIAPSLEQVGAQMRTFSSPYADDVRRYKLQPTEAEHLVRRLERELPSEVADAVSHAVRQHGADTADLLRHVYLTAPMLNAKPGQILDFGVVVHPREPVPSTASEPVVKIGVREKRRRASILTEARAEIQRRLTQVSGRRVAPSPAPRYDQVFFEGTAELDRVAGEPATASRGELRFDDSIWLSSQRRDPGIS